MYIIICEIDRQSRFDAWGRVLKAGALWGLRGMGWGGRWEGGSGWETRVHSWLIHVNVWQKPPQYCKVISLQLKKEKGNMWQGPASSSRDTYNSIFECFCRNSKAPSKLKMVTSGWAQDSWRLPCYLTSQSEESLHTVDDNKASEPLPKWFFL